MENFRSANKYMIVSFDVGIKNLSYCSLVKNAEGVYTIDKWGILNLCGQGPICCASSKTGKVCGAKAGWDSMGKTYCSRHRKSEGKPEAPEAFYKLRDGKRIAKAKLAALATETGNATTIANEDLVADIENKYSTKIATGKSANDMDLISVSQELARLLPVTFDMQAVETLLIENQIGPLAGRMKVVQGMITQAFIDRQPNVHVLYVSSANKLKGYDVPSKTYAERKASGISVVRGLLTDQECMACWRATFEAHKKKDDLADSYLQALWFINKES